MKLLLKNGWGVFSDDRRRVEEVEKVREPVVEVPIDVAVGLFRELYSCFPVASGFDGSTEVLR
jgi:hypothetical protein